MSVKPQVELSVIIPVYNEVDNVESLYQEIVNALPEQEFIYEILFIDDGSTDGTVQRLQELEKTSPHLRALIHTRNFGQSAALLTGARAAIYPMLVTMDGDGQNDPKDIPRLFAARKDGKTVVLGNRKKRDDSYLKRLSSRIGNGVRRSLLHDDCPDTGCSLKLFPKDAFLALPHFNHLHRYLPALFRREGYSLVNLPVNHRQRLHGTSKYGVMNRLFVGIHDLIGVRWLLKRPCKSEVSTYEH